MSPQIHFLRVSAVDDSFTGIGVNGQLDHRLRVKHKSSISGSEGIAWRTLIRSTALILTDSVAGEEKIIIRNRVVHRVNRLLS